MMIDPPEVRGTATVVAGRGNHLRLVILVDCPACLHAHLHLARVDFQAGIREAPCGFLYWINTPRPQAAP